MDEPLSTFGDPSKLITESTEYKQRQLIAQLALRDPGLSSAEKELLRQKLNEPGVFEKVMHGSMGASIAYAIAKFLKMSKETQVLMSMLGFGIGNMFLKASGDKPEKKKGTHYNKEKKLYEVDV